MKFIPEGISRKIASVAVNEKTPRVMFVGGVVGMVGSTVLACRATLKLESVLDEVEANKKQAHQVKTVVEAEGYEGESTYTDSELKHDLTIITMRGLGSVVKLYAPSVLLGTASIFALTKSHNLLQERNLALTAAYAAVDGAFKRYRERIIEQYGEDVDRDAQFSSETVDLVDEKTGEMRSVTRATDAPGSRYARFYDQDSSRNWSKDPDINLLFLRNVQNYMNDRLRIRGHVFLNEVFSELGLSHTKAGAVVGWRWQKGSGDDYIDLGIWEGHEVANDFFNGREGAVLLDFNVDGIIYDKIEEGIG